MSEEVLHIAEKRREAKGKGEKERYTHINVRQNSEVFSELVNILMIENKRILFTAVCANKN